MKKLNTKSKKTIIISILCLIIIFVLVCIGPFLLFTGSILWEMFINTPSAPEVKYGEFPFEIVYEYDGKKATIRDTIICQYEGYSFALDGGNTRDWHCYMKNSDDYGYYYIDKENHPDLYIYVPIDAEYYMGAPHSDIENARPYIYYNVYEENENSNDEQVSSETSITNEIELIENEDPREKVNVKILEWKPSKPIKNNFN